MISSKEMAHMSVEQLAQAIETHQQELVLLYQAMANKISKETVGEKSLKDDNVFVGEYWFQGFRSIRSLPNHLFLFKTTCVT